MRRPVEGDADPQFEHLVEVFARTLDDAPFGGAALCVVRGGRRVVDVWGGTADVVTGRPWARDTLAVAFSCTKSVTAVVVHRLAERGALDLDAPVARYWPEFGGHGKERVTLRHVMSHRAGVPVVDALLTRDDVLQREPLLRALEAQPPAWEPGTGHFYHAITGGAVLDEVVRRATGASIGVTLRREIAEPLGLDLWIGLPEAHHARVATVLPVDPRACDPAADTSGLVDDAPAARSVTLNGAVAIPRAGVSMANGWNDPRLWAAEVPAAGGIGTARAFAALHAAVLGGGTAGPLLGGRPLLRARTLREALEPQSSGRAALGPEARPPYAAWGTGFMIASPARPLLGPTSFGHDGAAGALCVADADADVALAYLPSQFGPLPDPRPNAIAQALRACLG